jgi:hypothetical protein
VRQNPYWSHQTEDGAAVAPESDHFLGAAAAVRALDLLVGRISHTFV